MEGPTEIGIFIISITRMSRPIYILCNCPVINTLIFWKDACYIPPILQNMVGHSYFFVTYDLMKV